MDSADTDVQHVHQWSGFLNRVRWFDSGRGHLWNPFSEAASRPFQARAEMARFASVRELRRARTPLTVLTIAARRSRAPRLRILWLAPAARAGERHAPVPDATHRQVASDPKGRRRQGYEPKADASLGLESA